jgi:hypothetical protein
MANLFDPQEKYDNTYQGQRDRRADHNAAGLILGAPAPQTQNVSGWAVPPSATSQMAQALRNYGAMQQWKNTMPPAAVPPVGVP